MPEELLADVDEAAKANFMCRSEYIRWILHQEISKLDLNQRYKKQGDEPWIYDADDS